MKHWRFWALCLCGAPALGLGYLAGDWLVGTGWGRDMGALVGLATILGAACRYERLNDVFGFQRLGKRQNNKASDVGAGAGAVLLALALPFGGGGAAASIGPSSTSPEALLEVVAEVEHLEAVKPQ